MGSVCDNIWFCSIVRILISPLPGNHESRPSRGGTWLTSPTTSPRQESLARVPTAAHPSVDDLGLALLALQRRLLQRRRVERRRRRRGGHRRGFRGGDLALGGGARGVAGGGDGGDARDERGAAAHPAGEAGAEGPPLLLQPGAVPHLLGAAGEVVPEGVVLLRARVLRRCPSSAVPAWRRESCESGRRRRRRSAAARGRTEHALDGEPAAEGGGAPVARRVAGPAALPMRAALGGGGLGKGGGGRRGDRWGDRLEGGGDCGLAVARRGGSRRRHV
mmetsp:Transcript_37346/g.121453  ORF Transcript_37346/g.121453 Transcript_37346/m.121453 type:complete len:276 (-) Transcript_37346:808-1635(-)